MKIGKWGVGVQQQKAINKEKKEEKKKPDSRGAKGCFAFSPNNFLIYIYLSYPSYLIHI